MDSSGVLTTTESDRERTQATSVWMLWLAITVGWWVFAFYPIHSETPEWVLRTQYVCFGSLPNGLPAPEGWILLVCAPVLLGISLAAIYPKSVRDLVHSKLAIFLFIAAIASTTTWVAPKILAAKANPFAAATLRERSDDERLPGAYPQVHQKIPSFQMVDHRGEKVTAKDLKGKVTLFSFIYAHCTTVCPGLTAQAKDFLAQVSNPQVQVVLISLDPHRDTPSSLPSLVKRWDIENARLRFLSGSPDDVLTLLSQLGVVQTRNDKTGEITHAPLVAISDTTGSIRYWFNRAPTQWMIDASTKLLQ